MILSAGSVTPLSGQHIQLKYDRFENVTSVIADAEPIAADDETEDLFTRTVFKAATGVGKKEELHEAKDPILVRVAFQCQGEGICRPDSVLLSFISEVPGRWGWPEEETTRLILLLDRSIRIAVESDPTMSLIPPLGMFNMPYQDFQRAASASLVEYRLGVVESALTEKQLATWKELVAQIDEAESLGN